jgi:hypothetical protein
MEIYLIWNIKEERPAIMQGNYGRLVAYLTSAQAMAYEATGLSEEGYEIRKFMLVAPNK